MAEFPFSVRLADVTLGWENEKLGHEKGTYSSRPGTDQATNIYRLQGWHVKIYHVSRFYLVICHDADTTLICYTARSPILGFTHKGLF
jgi:hypothetical protein